MTSRFVLAFSLAAATFAAAAQATDPPSAKAAPAPAPVDDLVPVALDTRFGRIVIALDRGHAPITTANFLRYVDSHRFDGESFYRALKMNDGGLIQGGVRSDSRKLYPAIKHEGTDRTGLKNVAGAVVMANAGAGTAHSDFFILLNDTPAFNANDPQGDATGFAVFGHVVEGMDVVRKIFDSPVSETRGPAEMKGQMLDPAITITKAVRVK